MNYSVRNYVGPAVAAIGYLASWATVSAFGFSASASPVGNSTWGDIWFAGALLGVVLAFFADNLIAVALSAVAVIGSLVYIGNFTKDYYQLPDLSRALIHLNWGFWAAALGSIFWLANLAYNAINE